MISARKAFITATGISEGELFNKIAADLRDVSARFVKDLAQDVSEAAQHGAKERTVYFCRGIFMKYSANVQSEIEHRIIPVVLQATARRLTELGYECQFPYAGSLKIIWEKEDDGASLNVNDVSIDDIVNCAVAGFEPMKRNIRTLELIENEAQ